MTYSSCPAALGQCWRHLRLSLPNSRRQHGAGVRRDWRLVKAGCPSSPFLAFSISQSADVAPRVPVAPGRVVHPLIGGRKNSALPNSRLLQLIGRRRPREWQPLPVQVPQCPGDAPQSPPVIK